MMGDSEGGDDDLVCIVRMLHHLDAFLDVGESANYIHDDRQHPNDERETLLCLKISLQQTIETLSTSEREAIYLVGFNGLSEGEAADRLKISRQALNKKLKTAARNIHDRWQAIALRRAGRPRLPGNLSSESPSDTGDETR